MCMHVTASVPTISYTTVTPAGPSLPPRRRRWGSVYVNNNVLHTR